MTGDVRIAQQGAVAEITFDNEKKRNAISLEMWQALGKAVRGFEFDESVRVIVVRGAGEAAFVSGADISKFDEERRSRSSAQSYEDATRHALDAIRISTKPTIALIHGYCYGAGVAIAAACDLRYARADAKFSIPAGKLGFGYAVHLMADLVNVVGPARAKEILLTAKAYSAREAAMIGLVHEVFPTIEFEDRTAEIIKTTSENAPLTMRATKAAVAALAEHHPSGALKDADRAVLACFASQDSAEGRRAFAEKRKPNFTGS